MLPPLADEVKPPVPHRTVALSAPLSQWCLVQCFDTAQQCESMRQNWYDDGSHKLDVLLSYDGKFTLSLHGGFAELFVRWASGGSSSGTNRTSPRRNCERGSEHCRR
jgi:hypothetical protein